MGNLAAMHQMYRGFLEPISRRMIVAKFGMGYQIQRR